MKSTKYDMTFENSKVGQALLIAVRTCTSVFMVVKRYVQLMILASMFVEALTRKEITQFGLCYLEN